jgi:hypothetical protein
MSVLRYILFFSLYVALCLGGKTNTTNKSSAPFPSAAPKTLKAYIHIGPHKTGSTHIQEFSVTHKALLENAGFCFPFYTKKVRTKLQKSHTDRERHAGIKKMNDVFNNLVTNESSTHFAEFITPCISAQKNIFVTSEVLSVINAKALRTFKASFPPNYDLEIIVVYREWLTRMFSQYTEQAKRSISQTESISERIFHSYASVGKSPLYNYTSLVENYAKEFQREKIHVIDYYGIEEAGKDLTFAIFCEIMKLPVFCNSTNFNITSRSNSKPDAHFIHLVALLRDYFHTKGYEVNSKLKSVVFIQYSKDLVTNYTRNPELENLPVQKSNLKLVHSYALDNDQEFRNLYGQQMLYANPAATLKTIKQLEATEIDTKKFYVSTKWNKWLEKEFQRLLKDGIIILRKDTGK